MPDHLIEVKIEDVLILLPWSDETTLRELAASAHKEWQSYNWKSFRRTVCIKDSAGRVLPDYLRLVDVGQTNVGIIEIILDDIGQDERGRAYKFHPRDIHSQYRNYQLSTLHHTHQNILALSSSEINQGPDDLTLDLIEELSSTQCDSVQLAALKILNSLMFKFTDKKYISFATENTLRLCNTSKYENVVIAVLDCLSYVAINLVNLIDSSTVSSISIIDILERFPHGRASILVAFQKFQTAIDGEVTNISESITLASVGDVSKGHEGEAARERSMEGSTSSSPALESMETYNDASRKGHHDVNRQRSSTSTLARNGSRYDQRKLSEHSLRTSPSDMLDAAKQQTQTQTFSLPRLLSLVVSDDASVRRFGLAKLLDWTRDNGQLCEAVGDQGDEAVRGYSVSELGHRETLKQMKQMSARDAESLARSMFACLKMSLDSRAAATGPQEHQRGGEAWRGGGGREGEGGMKACGREKREHEGEKGMEVRALNATKRGMVEALVEDSVRSSGIGLRRAQMASNSATAAILINSAFQSPRTDGAAIDLIFAIMSSLQRTDGDRIAEIQSFEFVQLDLNRDHDLSLDSHQNDDGPTTTSPVKTQPFLSIDVGTADMSLHSSPPLGLILMCNVLYYPPSFVDASRDWLRLLCTLSHTKHAHVAEESARVAFEVLLRSGWRAAAEVAGDSMGLGRHGGDPFRGEVCGWALSQIAIEPIALACFTHFTDPTHVRTDPNSTIGRRRLALSYLLMVCREDGIKATNASSQGLSSTADHTILDSAGGKGVIGRSPSLPVFETEKRGTGTGAGDRGSRRRRPGNSTTRTLLDIVSYNDNVLLENLVNIATAVPGRKSGSGTELISTKAVGPKGGGVELPMDCRLRAMECIASLAVSSEGKERLLHFGIVSRLLSLLQRISEEIFHSDVSSGDSIFNAAPLTHHSFESARGWARPCLIMMLELSVKTLSNLLSSQSQNSHFDVVESRQQVVTALRAMEFPATFAVSVAKLTNVRNAEDFDIGKAHHSHREHCSIDAIAEVNEIIKFYWLMLDANESYCS